MSPDGRRCAAGRIEAAALDLVGTMFRPQGRGCEGLDCLGVALGAARGAGLRIDAPGDLPLRGVACETAVGLLENTGCRAMPLAAAAPGDLLMQLPAARQIHLAVVVTGGIVEAHAGLRRVVMRPLGDGEAWHSAWRLPTGDD